MAEEPETKVDLGFVEESDTSLLANVYFPSKVGGKPAWLELKNLPNPSELKCSKCMEPKIFLCQIYAPIDDRGDCFHRSIFIFICRNESCCIGNSSENISVFRSQLARENPYYPSEPPNENEELAPKDTLEKLCAVCGCRAPHLCSQCKAINYCSAAHQKKDWKYHKKVCTGQTPKESTTPRREENVKNSLLFKEFEIVIEPEPPEMEKKNGESEEEAELRRKQEYEELVKSDKVGELKDVAEDEIETYVTENLEKDKQFVRFKKRIKREPNQILRYERKGSPLWITDENPVDESEVPNCENCGEKRSFEFQIMPQLLNYLKEDGIDWGVIAVYTCESSCPTKSGYLREYAVKQDIKTEKVSAS